MSSTALERVLGRDRAIILAALLFISAVAWAYTLWLALDMAMPAQDTMPGMGEMMAPVIHPWSAAELGFTFAMWAVMMTGMMTPSAAPMVLLYARIARQARADGHVFTSTFWFATGYLAAWAMFAAIATAAQAALLDAALITPMLASAASYFGAAVLIAAGIYEWTPLKDACLVQCQSPLNFLMRHGGFKPQAHRAFALGARHGLYCIGCCWALMALLFVGGVMNILWIAGIAIFVLIQKLVPGKAVSRAAGTILIAAGAWLLLAPLLAK